VIGWNYGINLTLFQVERARSENRAETLSERARVQTCISYIEEISESIWINLRGNYIVVRPQREEQTRNYFFCSQNDVSLR